MTEVQRVEHPFEPIYDADSTILILGTMPSVKSRKDGFYYANPRNAFWRIIAYICEESVPTTVEEKTDLLIRNHIAIWDVCKSCDIEKSKDSSIKNTIPTDIPNLIKRTKIKRIYANGETAAKQYDKYVKKDIGLDIVTLISSSSARTAFTENDKMKNWKNLIELADD